MNEVILFDEPHILVKYLPNKKWVVANWRGDQTFDIVLDSLEKLLAGIILYRCEKVLCDQSALTGQPWVNASAWVENDYLPRLTFSTCRYFAWVQSRDLSYQKGTERVVRMPVWNMEYLIFDDLESATAWLNEC